jgi:Tfp pilus assembly protein PilV
MYSSRKHKVWRGRPRRSWRSEVGGGLTEALVSTAVTAFGVLSVATLFLYGTRLQTVAKDGSASMNLATAQLEQLRMLPNVSPQVQNGGSLTSDLANYSTTSGNYRVRWLVTSGPATTKDVTVLVTPINGLARPGQLEGLLWR